LEQQLGAVGAQVTLVRNPVVAGAPSPILNQDFDMALISVGSYPTDPSYVFDPLMLSTADVPGRGFNIASYWNDEVDRLLVGARRLPGCEPETRSELYQDAVAIMLEEAVYTPLGILATYYVATDRIDGFDPAVGQPFWNINTWTIRKTPGS
jgi:ABC-type transport system substrate-binding protein